MAYLPETKEKGKLVREK